MAVTPSQFRTDFPAFADTTAYPDAAIQFWLTLATAFVGDWGTFTDQATELFAAHNLFLGPTGVTGGGVTGGGVSGPIQSKSIKDVSVTYNSTIGTDEGAGFYNATIYGRQWWQLRRLFGQGVIYLSGATIGPYYATGTMIYPLSGL